MDCLTFFSETVPLGSDPSCSWYFASIRSMRSFSCKMVLKIKFNLITHLYYTQHNSKYQCLVVYYLKMKCSHKKTGWDYPAGSNAGFIYFQSSIETNDFICCFIWLAQYSPFSRKSAKCTIFTPLMFPAASSSSVTTYLG